MEKTRFEVWLGLLSFIPCEDMLACVRLIDMLRVFVLRGNCVMTFWVDLLGCHSCCPSAPC